VYTPEQSAGNTKKRPDYTVEALETDEFFDPFPWLSMEFKKWGGEPTYLALNQLVKTVGPTLKENTAVYLQVIAGVYVSYWELDYEFYQNYVQKKDPGKIKHLWGARSLTQRGLYPGDEGDAYFDLRKEIKSMRPTILPIHDNMGYKDTNEDTKKIRKEAKKYGVRALFDLRKSDHWGLIEKAQVYTALRKPVPFTLSTMEEYTTETSDTDLGEDSDMDQDMDDDMEMD
jgi:hypothetical protein